MAATGLSVWTYGAMLCVLTAMSLASEGRLMLRVTLALLANWASHIAYWYVSQQPSPYLFSIAADTLTAVVILSRPAGRMQAFIGWTLLVQITIHFAYCLHLLNGGHQVQAEQSYWAWLDWIALGQIVLLGGWIVGRGGRSYLRAGSDRHRSGRHDPSGVAHP